MHKITYFCQLCSHFGSGFNTVVLFGFELSSPPPEPPQNQLVQGDSLRSGGFIHIYGQRPVRLSFNLIEEIKENLGKLLHLLQRSVTLSLLRLAIAPPGQLWDAFQGRHRVLPGQREQKTEKQEGCVSKVLIAHSSSAAVQSSYI